MLFDPIIKLLVTFVATAMMSLCQLLSGPLTYKDAAILIGLCWSLRLHCLISLSFSIPAAAVGLIGLHNKNILDE